MDEALEIEPALQYTSYGGSIGDINDYENLIQRYVSYAFLEEGLLELTFEGNIVEYKESPDPYTALKCTSRKLYVWGEDATTGGGTPLVILKYQDALEFPQ